LEDPLKKEVSPGGVIKELKKQHEELSKQGKRWASLFNLVVYTDCDTKKAEYVQLLQKMIEKFPVRLIFITVKKEARFKVEASSETSGEIVYDLIEIEGGNEDLKRIPSLVFSLFIPDLPNYLLWGEDPALHKMLFDDLWKTFDRIFIDSSSVNDLSQLKETIPGFRDLNWAAITGWRHLLSKTFDTPAMIADLRQIQKITLCYVDKKCPTTTHPEIEALYLKCWLQAKMDISKLEAVMVPIQADYDNGDIVSVAIEIANGHSYEFKRKNLQVLLISCSNDICELPKVLALSHVSRGFHYWRELFYEQLSPDYSRMLKVLCTH
jgi:hypothetical protein